MTLGTLVDRAHRELTPEEIDTIAGVYHAWCSLPSPSGRGAGGEGYQDNRVPFEKKMAELTAQLYEQFDKASKLEATIKQNLAQLGFGERDHEQR